MNKCYDVNYKILTEMKIIFSLILMLFYSLATAQEQSGTTLPPTPEIQIKTALLAAPSDKREGAMVYGYSSDGKLIVLRTGTNDMICLADNPKQRGIQVSCYYYKLDAFMARGRELLAEGKTLKERFDIREEEVKSGKLKMPEEPSILFVVQGTEANYNRETGELKDAFMRYVIYIPYATSASTGLPEKPDVPGMPWIMDPGTHRAHIMITPPLPSQNKEQANDHHH